MTRHVLWLTALAMTSFTGSGAQPADAPRNDLPQPYRTTRDWGELPPGVKWAAVTAIEPAPDGSLYVIHRCFENSTEHGRQISVRHLMTEKLLCASQEIVRRLVDRDLEPEALGRAHRELGGRCGQVVPRWRDGVQRYLRVATISSTTGVGENAAGLFSALYAFSDWNR